MILDLVVLVAVCAVVNNVVQTLAHAVGCLVDAVVDAVVLGRFPTITKRGLIALVSVVLVLVDVEVIIASELIIAPASDPPAVSET